MKLKKHTFFELSLASKIESAIYLRLKSAKTLSYDIMTRI